MDLQTYAGRPLAPGTDPQQAFRWDQDLEFIGAIQENRPAVPSFHDGTRVQAVTEAIVASAAEGRSVEVPSA